MVCLGVKVVDGTHTWFMAQRKVNSRLKAGVGGIAFPRTPPFECLHMYPLDTQPGRSLGKAIVFLYI